MRRRLCEQAPSAERAMTPGFRAKCHMRERADSQPRAPPRLLAGLRDDSREFVLMQLMDSHIQCCSNASRHVCNTKARGPSSHACTSWNGGVGVEELLGWQRIALLGLRILDQVHSVSARAPRESCRNSTVYVTEDICSRSLTAISRRGPSAWFALVSLLGVSFGIASSRKHDQEPK